MTANTSTPRELGYRFPAEWEPHAATWLAWPHNRDTWPGTFDRIVPQYARFARTIAQFEPLHVLAGGEHVMRSAESWLGHLSNVTLHDIATNDAWIRDFGPIFLNSPNQPLALLDWDYNAWGNKYPPFDHDVAACSHIARHRGIRRFAPGIVLEGGSIDGNGQGVVLTTRTCLLNPNRNPRRAEAEIEQLLAEYLGASTVIWLDGSIAGDDTDGHVDQLARFVSADTVAVASEENPADENYAALLGARSQLQHVSTEHNQPLEIVALPMPSPVGHQGSRLPASYANFYLVNSAVIVPQFDDDADDRACRILQELFPERDVIGLPCRDLVGGLGGFHCLTQQEPA